MKSRCGWWVYGQFSESRIPLEARNFTIQFFFFSIYFWKDTFQFHHWGNYFWKDDSKFGLGGIIFGKLIVVALEDFVRNSEVIPQPSWPNSKQKPAKCSPVRFWSLLGATLGGNVVANAGFVDPEVPSSGLRPKSYNFLLTRK